MEKRGRFGFVNGEITLPEDVIKHIQSFLSGNEAVQTTLLSKSWYRAWLTRPNLDFDQGDFLCGNDGVAKYARKTLRRYEELNLKIESFKLRMRWCERGYYTFIKELIVRAMKLGASDLKVKLHGGPGTFVLPPEVLESEDLTRLSVSDCRIAVGKVCCSRLESLNLPRVQLEGDMFFEIISRCPLVEKLVLSECGCITNVKYANVRVLEFGPLKQNLKPSVVSSMNMFELHKLKLKHLFLEKVKIGTSFFTKFSSWFPCLNDLTLHDCIGFQQVQIYSPSLPSISFAQKSVSEAKFDVPRIREFSFMFACLPSLSIETASTEWKTNLLLKCDRPSTSWFFKLNKFLKNSNLSRIFLFLECGGFPEKSFYCKVDVKGLPKPIVQDLFVLTDIPSSHCSGLLGGIFSCCRPKLIGTSNNDMLKLLHKTFTQNRSGDGPNPFGLNDLKEVNVKIFEESLAQWQSLLWKTWLNASAGPTNNVLIRFQLV